jgi:hypothetical protein
MFRAAEKNSNKNYWEREDDEGLFHCVVASFTSLKPCRTSAVAERASSGASSAMPYETFTSARIAA